MLYPQVEHVSLCGGVGVVMPEACGLAFQANREGASLAVPGLSAGDIADAKFAIYDGAGGEKV
jgi:hypothetical protein